MSELIRIHTIIKGYVQGIGYRWFVQRAGKKFNLTGWVKNLANGNVELEAEGKKEDLERFLNSLRNEYSWASVNELKTEWFPNIEETSIDFEIRF